jgi:hypothetical protein
MSPPSSGSKNKPAPLITYFHAGFLFALFFAREHVGDISSESKVDLQRTAWRYTELFITTAVRSSNPTKREPVKYRGLQICGTVKNLDFH